MRIAKAALRATRLSRYAGTLVNGLEDHKDKDPRVIIAQRRLQKLQKDADSVGEYLDTIQASVNPGKPLGRRPAEVASA